MKFSSKKNEEKPTEGTRRKPSKEDQPPRRLRQLLKNYETDVVYNPQNGKKEIVARYIGRYYCRHGSKQQLKRTKICYAILWLLGTFLFFLAETVRLEVNASKFSAAMQGVVLLGLLVSVCGLIKFFTSKAKMKEDDYFIGSVVFKYAALATGISLCVLAAPHFYSIFRLMENVLLHLGCAVVLLAGGFCFFALFVVEMRASYTEEDAQAPTPKDDL